MDTKNMSKNMNKKQVENFCLNIAKFIGKISDSKLPVYDMVISLAEWRKNHIYKSMVLGTFYLFVRWHGTESGTLQYCEERCKILGEPVAIIKIHGDGFKTCEVECKIDIKI